MGTDIDERKRAEEALRQSEARRATAERDLQLMIDTIPVYVAAYEPDGTRSFVNQTWQQYMGLTVEEATGPNGRKTFPHFHPEDAERIDWAWRASLARGQPLLTEARVRRADGQYRWHTSHRVPLRDEQGKIIRWYSVGVDIDNQKSAEDGLRCSEARLAAAERELQLTIDTIPTLVATYRPDGSRIFVNQTWRDYLGLRPDDAVDAFRTAVVHPEDAARVLEEWQRCLTSELPFSAEMRLRRADGVYRWHTVHRVLARDESGAVVKWYSVGVDIEEQKRSEERLRRSEARIAAAERELQLTIDTIPTLVATYRPDGSRLFVNQTWLDYTGLSPESAINSERADIVHPEDAARTAQEWKNCLVTGAPFKAEVRLRRADGEYRWHSVHRVLARDETGAVAKWYSVGVDIEEQKRAEERLRESEYNSRLIADSIPGFIIIFTPDGNFEGVNRQTIEYFGKTLDDVTSKRWSTRDAIHPEDYPSCTELFKQSIESGNPFEFELRFRRSDGVYRWFQSRGLPLRDADGRIVRWYNLLIDIDERKRAEEALRESQTELKAAQRELQLAMDLIPVLVAAFQADGTRIFVNQTWQRYTGLTLRDVADEANVPLHPHFHPDDAEPVKRAINASLASGELLSYEVRMRAANGEYRWHYFRGEPLRDENGTIIRWYTSGFDIHDKKLAELALRQSEARLAGAERELRLTLDSIPTMTWRAAPNGYVQSLNKRWFDYTGSTPEQSQHNGWRSFVHPDDLAELVDSGRRNIPAGRPVDVAARLRRFDGEYRWFVFRVEPMRDESGGISAWYGAITDIEDRKLAEDALQESQIRLAETERDLRIMLDSIPTITWRAGSNGYVQYLNKRWFEYTGTTPDQVRGWRWKLCVHPDDLDPLVEAGNIYVTSGDPIDSEARLRRFDGEYRWFLFRPAPVRDEAGNVVAWYGTITDIEDRKRAEQKALEAERELQRMLDTIPAINVRGATNGYIQYFSKQWFEYTGTTLETAKGFRWWQSLHPDDKDRLVEFGARFVATTEPGDCEARLRRFDGVYRWFLFRPAPARNEAGEFIGWYGTVTDIEDRKQAEQKALEAEREVQRTIDSIPVLVGTYSAEGKRLSVNKWALEVTGLSADDMPDERWKKAFHPDELEAVHAQWRQCLARGEPFEREVRTRMADGTYRAHLTRRLPLRDETGQVIRWYGIAHDIEDQKRAEQALVASERNLQLTFDTMPAIAWSASADGSAEFFNQNYLNYVGLPLEQVLGWGWTSVVHPDDLTGLGKTWQTLLATGKAGEAEARLRRHDGIYRWFLFRTSPLHDENGNIVKWYGVNTDIEDLKGAEEELRRSETILAEGQRISSTGSFSWRVDTNELKFSEELGRIFEIDQATSITFERVFSRIHPEDMPALSERMKLIRSSRPPGEQEVRLRMEDGRIKYLRSVGHMMHHPDGRLEYLGAIQDITQRRIAEQGLDKVRSELAHVTRVMSLGALTASIAHEVNQPLAGIITNASTCLRMLATDPPNVDGARETARRTIRDGNRAADVITRLRALFGRKGTTTEILDLNEATREVVALVFSDLLRNRVIVRVELDDEPLLVTGDRVQLQQVILNLVRNASDAMSEVNDRPRNLLVTADREHDGSARLTVTDAGVGLHPQTAERLFDAFYTSKTDGMGIGLSVSRSIIESHGGKIWAETNDGPGATFSFSIPRQAADAGDEGTAGAILTRPTRGAQDQTRNA